MYKTIKTMRQALAEARAYRDPVNEDRGFSTQQIKMAYGILNDPRYKQGNYSGAVSAIEKIAKGLSDHPDVANALRRANEELEEETINEMNAVNYARKLSSYAVKRGGIDKTSFMKIANSMASANNDTDIKRIGKQVDDMDTEPRDLVKGSIAIHMGPKTFEKMFGDRLTASDIKQYRRMTPSDLAEETITEFKKMIVTIKDPTKRAKAMDDIKRFGKGTGFRIDKMSDGKSFRIDGQGADLNKFATDMKNFYGATVKAENLEERVSKQDAEKFDMAKYKENERDNQHSDNALLLVKKFGTAADYKKVVDIDIRHQKAGSISMADLKTRNDISRKYIGRLM